MVSLFVICSQSEVGYIIGKGMKCMNHVYPLRITTGRLLSFIERVHALAVHSTMQIIAMYISINPLFLFTCCGHNCGGHSMILDSPSNELLQCIVDGYQYLPKRQYNSRSIPSRVCPLCPAAAFWHIVWCECGHPTSTVLFQIKKITPTNYEVHRRRR